MPSGHPLGFTDFDSKEPLRMFPIRPFATAQCSHHIQLCGIFKDFFGKNCEKLVTVDLLECIISPLCEGWQWFLKKLGILVKILHEGLVWKISTEGASPLQGAGSWRSYSYILVTFVNISNIPAVTDPILTKLFGPNIFGALTFGARFSKVRPS